MSDRTAAAANDGVPMVQLYCWRHDMTHPLYLDEVERIVYTLSLNVPIAYRRGRADEAGSELDGEIGPECPLMVCMASTETRGPYAAPVARAVEFRQLGEQSFSGRAAAALAAAELTRDRRGWLQRLLDRISQ